MSNYQGVPVIRLDESDHEEAASSDGPVHTMGKEKEVQIIDLECPSKTGSSSKADSAKMNKDYDEHVPASRAITHQDDQEHVIELRCTAACKLMGAVTFKDFGNMRMRGTVVEYDLENGWFKIRYQNSDEEEMSKEDVIQFLADPEPLRPYFDHLPASLSTHRPKKIKNLPCYQNKVAIIHASNRPIPSPLHPPTHQKRPRKAKQPTTYIPLAVRERKKDDYVCLSTHRPKKIKNHPCYQNKVAIIHASNRPIPPPLHPPTHQKRPRKAKQPTTYIPLAVKERKKDDYVWYK